MQVIPAIDLRDGACVQLIGGSYADERVRIANPLEVAGNWAGLGFGRIHLVDLDAATGRGSNREIVKTILGLGARKWVRREKCLRVQCGGGVRDLYTIAELLASGASEIVVGTRAIEDRAWLEDAVSRYPDRIIVAADARARQLVTHGWSKTGSQNVIDFIDEVSPLPLAAILVTAVEKEGRMEGPDVTLMAELALRSKTPLQASGGVRNVGDLRVLAELGVSGAVVGMALYTGALDPQTIIEEFPE
ncbi:MAG TPA: 1-(5-phosphoribosyl)-5-[(5-phosphoribosylamino)methylideneamino] imidazole-4-carboxamide isomerase [Gemmatimonadaceae bacterium]|nr:1-(5-phosphoribosyl)-5-[(5-phosphoribosylamino)methylideneamino] imidazole-4-carboxamide isomerase [Gemmatimonadaceae bacterium]